MHRRVLPVLALSMLLSAPAAAQTANPFPPVPPPMTEAIPKPPVSGQEQLWQPGHWNWNGAAYVWQPGEWVPAGDHGRLWQPGQWTYTGGGWTWEPAHWTS